jgi:Trk-type K+ transport system membrane component
MKTCPQCSARYPDNYAVCLKDGSALKASSLWETNSIIRRLYEILSTAGENWKPVSKVGGGAWLAFYGLFLLYALVHEGPGLFIDLVFVPIHEGGHLLFSYFGETLHILGGTFLQLFVPFALALYFRHQRQVYGTAFAAFFFFENFLNIATYMADARAQQLPLVTVGDAEFVTHDWLFIFSKCGLLAHDTSIAAMVRVLGWAGMVGVVFWLWRRTRMGGENKPLLGSRH